MALQLVTDKRTGQVSLRGQKASFARYERGIMDGSIPCPYRAKFLNTEFAYLGESHNEQGWLVINYKVMREGEVVHVGPVPLTPEGKPKIALF